MSSAALAEAFEAAGAALRHFADRAAEVRAAASIEIYEATTQAEFLAALDVIAAAMNCAAAAEAGFEALAACRADVSRPGVMEYQAQQKVEEAIARIFAALPTMGPVQ